MIDLTVVILTKNEEENLGKCIRSFNGIAKRFVIVDSYSTDQTKMVAEELNEEFSSCGVKIDFYENKWVDYATQFNWGIDNTDINTKWIMRMDADEEIMPELLNEMQEKIPSLEENITGIILRRRVYFMGKWIRHGGRYPEKLLRIFKNGYAVCEQKVMDEHLILKEGRMVEFKSDLIDNNTKDLTWWTQKHNWYSSREVLDHQLTVDNELKTNQLLENATSTKQAKRKRIIKNSGYYRLPKFFRSHLYFIYRYYIRLGFLDGKEGRIFHFLQAYWYRFLVDAKIFECEKYDRRMDKQADLK